MRFYLTAETQRRGENTKKPQINTDKHGWDEEKRYKKDVYLFH
jgi:hypothetical protein